MTSKTAVTVYPAVPKADAVCVCVWCSTFQQEYTLENSSL